MKRLVIHKNNHPNKKFIMINNNNRLTSIKSIFLFIKKLIFPYLSILNIFIILQI